MNDEKLQKTLAAAGFGSRREMERSIAAGEVKVNGKAAHVGERVKPGDKLQWRNKSYVVPSESTKETRVILYNKPEGQICSRNDPEGRPTVYDHLPALKSGRWVSVGRLDFNTSGLLLFTDDGELANKLMHPSSEIDREYLVRVQGEVDEAVLTRLREGVQLEDGIARFTDIKQGGGSSGSNSWFYCVLMEGRNREVRRLWESQNLRVSRLKRVRYGPIGIPSFIKMGQWIELGAKETAELCRRADMPTPNKRSLTPNELEADKRRMKKLRAGTSKGIRPSVRPRSAGGKSKPS